MSPSVQDDARELAEAHTKAELREMAYDEDMSIPRGATKLDIARMLTLPVACDSCGRTWASGHMEDWRGPGRNIFVLCPKCADHREGEEGWDRA